VLALLPAAHSAAGESSDWWTRHSTLIVGVVAIIISGFVGPTVTGWLTSPREAAKDERGFVTARRNELRELLDEAARVLAPAVTYLREMLAAHRAGQPTPEDADQWARGVFPLVQRLRLRLPENHPVVSKFEAVHTRLVEASEALGDQAAFDAAVDRFENARAAFLDEARVALQAALTEDSEAG